MVSVYRTVISFSWNPCWESSRMLFALWYLAIWLRMMCSITLQLRHVSEIGLLFAGSDFDLFLWIPVTRACFHCMCWLNKKVSAGTNSCATIPNSLGGSLSGLHTFVGFWDRGWFPTPAVLILRSVYLEIVIALSRENSYFVHISYISYFIHGQILTKIVHLIYIFFFYWNGFYCCVVSFNSYVDLLYGCVVPLPSLYGFHSHAIDVLQPLAFQWCYSKLFSPIWLSHWLHQGLGLPDVDITAVSL